MSHKSYFILPSPKERRALVLWGIAEAVRLGYEGVTFEIGTDAIQNPGTTDWGDFSTCVAAAAAAGLYLRLRGQLNVPRYAYSKGAVTGPSSWVTLYNSGVVWPEPFRPPIAVAKRIASLVWDRAWALAAAAYKAKGHDPLAYIPFEGANEPGIRGAGGAYSGSSFGSATWPSGPDGFIEPYFFAMLRAAIEETAIPATQIWPITLEGQYGAAAVNEMQCMVGSDAMAILARCPRLFTNKYCPSVSSADQAGSVWQTRWQAQVANVQNHLLKSFGHTVPLQVMESGFDLAYAKGNTVFAAEARQSVLLAARGVVDAGIFCAVNTNELTQDFNLFNASMSGSTVTALPVGKPVGPKAA